MLVAFVGWNAPSLGRSKDHRTARARDPDYRDTVDIGHRISKVLGLGRRAFAADFGRGKPWISLMWLAKASSTAARIRITTHAHRIGLARFLVSV